MIANNNTDSILFAYSLDEENYHGGFDTREQAEAASAARIREEQAAAVRDETQPAVTPTPAPAPTLIADLVGQPHPWFIESAGFGVAAFDSTPTERPTLKLGEIGARLGFNVTADFLEGLGFTATVEKNARLYKPSQFVAICTALQRHIASAAIKDYTEATQ